MTERLAVTIEPGKSISEAVERVQLAESLGLEMVGLSQLPNARDTPLVLAAYAQATSRIHVFPAVLPIYTRHPTATAQLSATLAELSGGRFRLGLGVSHQVTVESMWGLKLDRPAAAMREYVTIVREILENGSVSFSGTYFTAHVAYTAPRPERLPIILAAINPRSLEQAGEIADGTTTWMCAPGYIRDHVVPGVKAGREKAGKSLDGFDIYAAVPVSLTEDPAAAREVFRPVVQRYASLPFYRRVLDAAGFKDQLERDQISDAMLDELAGIGGPEQVRGAVERYRAAGATLVTLGPVGGHQGYAGWEATIRAAQGEG